MGVAALVRKIFTETGIHSERFSLQWASAAEAPRFVQLITDFTRKVKELGPLGQASGEDPEKIRKSLAIALALAKSQKLRGGFGNVTKTIRKEADFSEAHIRAAVDEKLSKTISAAFAEEK